MSILVPRPDTQLATRGLTCAELEPQNGILSAQIAVTISPLRNSMTPAYNGNMALRLERVE